MTHHSRQIYDIHPVDKVAVLDIETHCPDWEGEGFPPLGHHRPICASILTADLDSHGVVAFTLKTILFADREPEALSELEQVIGNRVLITYNGRGFDLPVLAQTAMRHLQFQLPYLSSLWRAYRFGDRHCDLADQFSRYGSSAVTSLEHLCGSLNIPAKGQAHGDEVGDLLAAGGIEQISHYCEEDVSATYLLYLHWVAFRENDPQLLVSGCSHFARFIESSDNEHLLAFARYDRTAWAHAERRLAIAQQIVRDLRARAEPDYVWLWPEPDEPIH